LNPFPVIVIDGFKVPAFSTDFSGNSSFAITLPPAGNPPNGVPLGLSLALQSLVADPFSSLGITLTAATQITVTQGPTITNLNVGDEGNYTLSTSAMPIPFYGINYTTIYANANGYITFGSQDSDFTPSPSEFNSAPPRIAAFWTDLDSAPSAGGTVTATVDNNPGGGNPGFIRFDYVNVEGWTVNVHHNFSALLRADGYLEIIYPATQNASIYDQMTGIGPGSGGGLTQKNFIGPQPTGSSVGPGILSTSPFAYLGNVNENFFEWFGVTGIAMPFYGNSYDNTFDLYVQTLHFLPSGSGGLPGASNRYTLY
jgi:hypothetical protein